MSTTVSFKKALAIQQQEDEGKWFALPDGGEAFVAYWGDRAFRRKLSSLEERYRKEHQLKPKKEVPPEDWEELIRRAVSGTVLKGFRGIVFDEAERGELEQLGFELSPASTEIPWSEKNGVVLMRSLRSVQKFVLDIAAEREAFHEEFTEEAVGS